MLYRPVKKINSITSLPDLSPIATTTTPFQPNSPFADIDVQIISVTTQSEQLTTRFRVYNGGTETLNITENGLQLALGYVSHPVGPLRPAENLMPLSLLPEQAVDLTLVWNWDNEPFASLLIGDFHYVIQIE